MKHSNTARIIAIIIAVVMMGGGAAVAVARTFGQSNNAVSTAGSSQPSEPASSDEISSEESETSSEISDDDSSADSFTFMELYEANITGNILENNTSVNTTVDLYFPDGSDFSYTRYAQKDENGEYYYHYIDSDGQEESIRRDNIFMTDTGESIRFQVAYDDEF